MKLYFTKQELIERWLDLYQGDACHDDLLTFALAGFDNNLDGYGDFRQIVHELIARMEGEK